MQTRPVFNPPPGWPPVPPGWVPEQGWKPDPSWPPAPADWNFYSAAPPSAAQFYFGREGWADGRTAPPVPAKRKRRVWLWVLSGIAGVLALVAALVVVVVVVAARDAVYGVGHVSAEDLAADRSSCAGLTYPDQQTTDRCGNASGVVHFKSFTITAAPLKLKSSVTGAALCTTIKIVNNGSKSENYSETAFKMQEPSGNVRDWATLVFDGGTLRIGVLIANGTVSGSVCSTNSGAGQYVLIYKPDWFDSSRATWLMTVR